MMTYNVLSNSIQYTRCQERCVHDLLPSRKHKVGEKYKLKYSIKDPNTYEVLWDEKVLGEEPKEDSSE